MKLAENSAERYRQAAQAAITNETVQAAGFLGLPGGTRASYAALASPAVSFFMRRSARNKTPGFPLSVLMAVTPTRIIALEYKMRGRNVQIKSGVVEWPRNGVVVQVGQTSPAVQLWFHLADGTTVELEGANMFGQARMNQPLYAALGFALPS